MIRRRSRATAQSPRRADLAPHAMGRCSDCWRPDPGRDRRRVWIARKPIANNVVASELDKRGVQATYKLERIGLRTQRVSNLVIGDPANPDLTARVAQVQMRLKWDGSVEFYRIAARGVRLQGRVVGNKVSWGQIDRLLPPPTRQAVHLAQHGRSISPTRRSRLRHALRPARLRAARARQSGRRVQGPARGVGAAACAGRVPARRTARLCRDRGRSRGGRMSSGRSARDRSPARQAAWRWASRGWKSTVDLLRGVRQLRRQGPADDGFARRRGSTGSPRSTAG